jgi:hypothetical protein
MSVTVSVDWKRWGVGIIAADTGFALYLFPVLIDLSWHKQEAPKP